MHVGRGLPRWRFVSVHTNESKAGWGPMDDGPRLDTSLNKLRQWSMIDDDRVR